MSHVELCDIITITSYSTQQKTWARAKAKYRTRTQLLNPSLSKCLGKTKNTTALALHDAPF